MSRQTITGNVIVDIIIREIANEIIREFPGANVRYVRKALELIEAEYGTDGVMYPRKE